MVRCGGVDQVVEDRRDDRIGGDRTGQAAQDPGEALGLAATARLEATDRVPVRDGGHGGHDHEPRGEEVDRLLEHDQPVAADERQHEERAGEEPPRSTNRWVPRPGTARSGWRSGGHDAP